MLLLMITNPTNTPLSPHLKECMDKGQQAGHLWADRSLLDL